MAGFPGNARKLGSAGLPPDASPPSVTATTNVGTSTFFELGIALTEDIAPNAPSNPHVNIKATSSEGNIATFFMVGIVMAESTSAGSSVGTFRVTATGSNGTDTYFVIGVVFAE